MPFHVVLAVVSERKRPSVEMVDQVVYRENQAIANA